MIRFLRRLQQSLRLKAKNQQNCRSSNSGTDDDDIDDSLQSEHMTQPRKTIYKTNEIDTDSPSVTQSKSTDSYSPPNVIHATKTTRSLSLNAGHSQFQMANKMRTDAYLDEVNSD